MKHAALLIACVALLLHVGASVTIRPGETYTESVYEDTTKYYTIDLSDESYSSEWTIEVEPTGYGEVEKVKVGGSTCYIDYIIDYEPCDVKGGDTYSLTVISEVSFSVEVTQPMSTVKTVIIVTLVAIVVIALVVAVSVLQARTSEDRLTVNRYLRMGRAGSALLSGIVWIIFGLIISILSWWWYLFAFAEFLVCLLVAGRKLTVVEASTKRVTITYYLMLIIPKCSPTTVPFEEIENFIITSHGNSLFEVCAKCVGGGSVSLGWYKGDSRAAVKLVDSGNAMIRKLTPAITRPPPPPMQHAQAPLAGVSVRQVAPASQVPQQGIPAARAHQPATMGNPSLTQQPVMVASPGLVQQPGVMVTSPGLVQQPATVAVGSSESQRALIEAQIAALQAQAAALPADGKGSASAATARYQPAAGQPGTVTYLNTTPGL